MLVPPARRLSAPVRTGAPETFLALGLAYFVVMMAAALTYHPAIGWRPAGWNRPTRRLRKMVSGITWTPTAAPHAAILSVVDHLVFQRHGRHRRAGGGAV